MSPVEALTRGGTAGGGALPFDQVVQALAGTDRSAEAAPQLRQGLRIGPLRLAIRYDEGSELLPMQPVCVVPDAPAWLGGLTQVHGALVPVVDVVRFLGLAAGSDAPAQPMLLVLGRGADALAVVIDGLPQRLKCPPSAVTDVGAAGAALRPVLRAAFLVDDVPWLDLDAAAFLDSVEAGLSGGDGL